MSPPIDPSQHEGPADGRRPEGDRAFFLVPRFIGPRFERHSIPLELLKDLAAFEELLIDVAKWKRKQAEQGRQRVPRGFTDGVRLELAAVEEGSARASLVLVMPALSALLFESDHRNYFEQARDAIVMAIEAAEQNEPERVLQLIPPESLRHFKNNIGKHLRDGESIGFPKAAGDGEAVLDKQTRQRLVFASSDEQYITEEAILRGAVYEADHINKTFKLRLADGSTVTGETDSSHWPTIAEAWSGFDGGRKVRIDGVVRQLRNNRLDRIESVEHATILDPLDIDARLDELDQIEDGWLDGHGKRPPTEGLSWLSTSFAEHHALDLALPYLYPTEGGGVQAEWPLQGGEASLEIDLITKRGLWCANFDDDRPDQEESFDLTQPESWKKFGDNLRNLGGLAE